MEFDIARIISEIEQEENRASATNDVIEESYINNTRYAEIEKYTEV